MAIQGFFTGDVKIKDLNGVLKAVDGIVEVATDAGTVTSVGLTVGSTGTDVNVANSPVTTSGSITLNIPTSSATNRGLLSSADWSTFNSKQGTITLTTTGSSGPATLIAGTLNIPNYSGALSGYVPYTGATGNVDLGEYGISSGYFQADLTPSGALQVGRMQWNSTDGTMDLRLMGNNVTLQIGQEQVARVVNGTGGNLLESNYQAVKIIGAQGQRLQVGLARADNDANSKDTLGLVTENIDNNQEGFITVSGLVNKINTTGSLQGETWSDGDTLYLSGTTAGAITNVKPTAPTHTVIVGFVVYAHANNGKIYVKVDNGYELEELHDVAPTPYVNKGVLYRDTATNLWKSATIGTLLGYTPANAATTLTINGTAYDISANRTWNVGTVTSVATTGPLTGGTITGSGTIGITQATTSTDGYLSSTDWNTFNNKQGALTFSAPLINTSGTISIPAASASVNGYLSSTDWATFNNKQAALSGTGFVKISGTTISYDNSTYYLASNPNSYIALTALSATAPLSYSNTTGVFSISQATTSTDGYLSSTDWNTFNNKQAAGNYITALTGEATASGPGSASVTLSTSAVTGKLLTGLNLTGGGTIAATDSILQAFGKVQNQISGLAGGVTYQGTWNASTNTPTLTSSVGTKGYYYIVDVAGSTNLNGITDWKIGDWAIFNGSTWDKVDNTDAVSSVNGFTGAVSLTTSNIAEGTNLYYLDSRARLALSFTAGSGAYDNTTGVITIPTNTSQLTNGANFITLSSLSASSPLAYNSGTGAFSIQVATGSQNGYLSSTDWTTFNSKQPAGNYVTTDTTQTITALKTFTAKVVINTGGTDDQLQLVGTAPSVRLTNAATGATINGFIAMSGGANNYIQGSVSGDMTIGNQNNGKILFGFGSGTATQKMSLDSSGNAVLSGGLTLGSTLSNGTYTYTLPGATGTLALTSQIPSNPVGGTGTTNYVSKFTGTSTIGNSLIYDNGSVVAIGTTVTGFNAYGLPLVVGSGSGNQGITVYSGSSSFGSLHFAYGTTGTQSYNGGFEYSHSDNQLNVLAGAGVRMIVGVNQVIIPFNSSHSAGSENFYVQGTARISSALSVGGQLTLGSTITNGTYTYTLPSATGTLALTSQIPANPVGGTGTTNYLPKFTGTSTIGNSVIQEASGFIGIGVSPSRKLHVLGGAATSQIQSTGTSSIMYFGDASSTVIDNQGFGSIGNSLYLLAGGVERLYLTSSGNLGLGTSSPSAKLFVVTGGVGSVSNGIGMDNGAQQHFWYLSDNTTSTYQINSGSGVFRWVNSNGELMRLNASGNLSIGNTNDTYKLDVTGTGRFSSSQADINIDSTSTSQFSRLRFFENGSATGGVQYINSAFSTTSRRSKLEVFNGSGIHFISQGNFNSPDFILASTGAATFSSSVTATQFIVGSPTTSSDVSIRYRTDTGDFSTINDRGSHAFGIYDHQVSSYRMYINTSGSVGIGTTSPQSKFQVTGGGIGAYHNTSGSGGAQIYLGDTNFDNASYYNSAPGIGSVYSPQTGVAGDLAFHVYASAAGSRSEAMRIIRTSSGNNVGIGTTSPTHRLQIQGASNSGLLITNSSGATRILLSPSGAQHGEFALYNNSDNVTTYLGGNGGNNYLQAQGGNVGIGTTSPSVALQVDASGGGIIRATRLGAGSAYIQLEADGTNGTLTSSAALIMNAGGSERMRITSGGNVVIGNTVASNVGLTIYGSNAATIYQTANTGTGAANGFYVGHTGDISYIWNYNNYPTVFATNNTERMRITSGGYLKASNDGSYFGSTGVYHELRQSAADWVSILSNTNASSPYGMFITYTGASPNNTGNEFLYCRDGGLTVRAIIRSNGGLANYQANDVNLSDIRTKKDITPLDSYWDKFKAIEMVKFKYKDQTHDDFNIGVIAQQVEKVAPEFVDVDGWGDTPKDGVPLKSIYTADLHHATIKVLQEAMAKIEDQQSQINELKSQLNK